MHSVSICISRTVVLPPATATATATATAAAAATATAGYVTWRTCADLLKLIEQVYPVESPDPAGLAVGIELRPYQRQSLAFMLDIEQRIDQGDRSAGRGGWLADEMGMGKTAVCAALILANPLKHIIGEVSSCLKATLIITHPTLLKQWQLELSKFAPCKKSVSDAFFGTSFSFFFLFLKILICIQGWKLEYFMEANRLTFQPYKNRLMSY